MNTFYHRYHGIIYKTEITQITMINHCCSGKCWSVGEIVVAVPACRPFMLEMHKCRGEPMCSPLVNKLYNVFATKGISRPRKRSHVYSILNDDEHSTPFGVAPYLTWPYYKHAIHSGLKKLWIYNVTPFRGLGVWLIVHLL